MESSVFLLELQFVADDFSTKYAVTKPLSYLTSPRQLT